LIINYLNTKGGTAPVGFESAVLQGYAADGGLFVPDRIPQLSPTTLKQWSTLDYVDLAFEILEKVDVPYGLEQINRKFMFLSF